VPEIGRFLVITGLALTGLGLLLWATASKGWLRWIGRLPGDLHIERGNVSIQIPIVTCLLLSLLISVLLRLFWR